MDAKLFSQALIKFLFGLVIVSLLLFIPAGSINYYNGWLFIALLSIPMLIAGIIMFFKSPELLKRRLNAKEEEKEQKIVILISGIMFLLAFILAGLNFRFGWFQLPQTVVIIASIIFILSYIMYAEVLRENMYLSRTVEVSENQKVINTGLYGIVRHPMYSAISLLYLSIPLVLGSWWALLTIFPCVLLLAARIKNEEMVLCQGLSGYETYIHKVRYKMVPWVW